LNIAEQAPPPVPVLELGETPTDGLVLRLGETPTDGLVLRLGETPTDGLVPTDGDVLGGGEDWLPAPTPVT